MAASPERNRAVAVGMSARIVTPDSSLPDRLAQFGGGETEGVVEGER